MGTLRTEDDRSALSLTSATSRRLGATSPASSACPANSAPPTGLVDELHLFVWPVVLGGRNAALPTDTRADLELVDEHRFSNGVMQLHYRLL
jgi:hypothetical protein